ncbi:putative cullin-like protein 2 [Aristolochia californica]|uniref:putative cullin-like protein 2 n=1 Tax=Aristolochia californica TaxID=171875 RepID=UPI0035DFD8A9
MVQIGDDTLRYYNKYFEDVFLNHTQEHYFFEAIDWGYVYSKERYIIKIAESLTMEEHIGSLFLHESTGPKLKQKLHSAFRAATLKVMVQLNSNGFLEASSSEEDD